MHIAHFAMRYVHLSWLPFTHYMLIRISVLAKNVRAKRIPMLQHHHKMKAVVDTKL